jgi:hypothetical protein
MEAVGIAKRVLESIRGIKIPRFTSSTSKTAEGWTFGWARLIPTCCCAKLENEKRKKNRINIIRKLNCF